ncbi:hypothetical protein ABW19_dt0205485 [Dactylella cylindrospora]|nr:hypothetical protein ABW19_dt0205485 [Dactylella cylindrospora]
MEATMLRHPHKQDIQQQHPPQKPVSIKPPDHHQNQQHHHRLHKHRPRDTSENRAKKKSFLHVHLYRPAWFRNDNRNNDRPLTSSDYPSPRVSGSQFARRLDNLSQQRQHTTHSFSVYA